MIRIRDRPEPLISYTTFDHLTDIFLGLNIVIYIGIGMFPYLTIQSKIEKIVYNINNHCDDPNGYFSMFGVSLSIPIVAIILTFSNSPTDCIIMYCKIYVYLLLTYTIVCTIIYIDYKIK
jgi:hypothetical protein